MRQPPILVAIAIVPLADVWQMDGSEPLRALGTQVEQGQSDDLPASLLSREPSM